MSLNIKDIDQIKGDILTDMVAAIPQLNTSPTSDTNIKATVYAAQFAGLYYNQQWIYGQIVPQTATGQILDYHAETRGIFRKSATKSSGVLRFSRATADTVDRIIPQGTECSTLPDRDGNTILVETTAEATLMAGSTFLDVQAQALEAGENGNTAAGTVTIMTVPPVGIESVVNLSAFIGGTEQETDDSLRERYIYACRNPQNGGTKSDYEQWALSISGITSALCLPLNRGNGTVDVVISANGIPTAEKIAEVQEYIDSRRPIGADAVVISPTLYIIDVTATIAPDDGYLFSDLQPVVTEAITAYINGLGLGGKFTLSGLGNAIYDVDGVFDYTITSPANNINIGATSIPTVGTITLTEV